MNSDLLVVTTSYPRYHGDYPGHYIQSMLKYLKEFFSVSVVCPESDTAIPPQQGVSRFAYFRPRAMQKLAYGNGIPVNIRNHPYSLLLAPGFLWSMYRAIARRISRNTILFSHWLFPSGWLAQKIAMKYNLPHIAVAHGSDVLLMERIPWAAKAVNRMLPKTNGIVCVSGDLKQRLASLTAKYSEKSISDGFYVQPMGHDICMDDDYSPWSPGSGSPFKLLFIGRLIASKGVGTLLEAAEKVSSVQLHFAGDGPERKTLERRAKDRRIDAVFHGTVNFETKQHLLRQSHAAVVPSLPGPSEGMPLSMIEAMAAGLPIIASRTGGIPEILKDHQNGLLTVPGSSTDLTDAVNYLINHPKKCCSLSDLARSTAKQYDAHTVSVFFRRLFEGITATQL